MSRATLVEELIELYASDSENKELEIRIKNYDYVDVLKKLDTVKYTHEAFLETLKYGDNTKHSIRISQSKSTNKIVKVAYHKTRLHYYITDLYSVNISEEIDDKNVTLDYRPDKLIFKNRFSFPHLLSSDWRVDITINMELENINLVTKDFINNYFTNNSDIVGLKKSIAKNPARYTCSIEIEYVGKVSKDIKIPSIYVFDTKLSGGAEKSEYMVCLKTVARFIESNDYIRDKKTTEPTVKFLLPQVKDLTKIIYMEDVYPPTNYMVTDKADGLRSLIYVRETVMNILNKSYTCIELSEDTKMCILDCELIGNKVLVFDIMYANGENVMHTGIEKRITHIPEIVKFLNKAQDKYIFSLKQYNSLTIRDKFKDAFESAVKTIDEYTKDGLILVSKQKPYYQTISYKWKDVKHQTFDMVAIKPPPALLNNINKIDGYDIYFLFCTTSVVALTNLNIRLLEGYGEMFPNVNTKFDRVIPMQFTLPYYPLAYVFYLDKKKNLDLHMKVGEFRISANNVSNGIYINWRFLQLRDDRPIIPNRYYGNNYKTVISVFINYIDPFPLEILINGFEEDTYFVSKKDNMYSAYTGFMSYAKETTMRKFIPKDSVVMDIGAGKGQDIFRYNKIGINSVLAVDKDSTAIVMLLNRWMDYYMYNKNPNAKLTTTLHTIVMDMNTNYKDNVSRITCKFSQKYDVIVCNLAIHYFLENVAFMKNLVNFCNSILSDNGIVVITCLSGEKIFDKVNKTGKYELLENNVIKFSIKKIYSDNTFENAGQRIEVLLPFSNGKYYTEFLVNLNTLKEEFKEASFMVESEKQLSEMTNNFKEVNPMVYEKLKDVDKEYIDLFTAIVFKRST
jgi:hypothetical protein